jgi:choline dehydrogenase-like flavoprotein
MPDCIRANTHATTIRIGEGVADLIKAANNTFGPKRQRNNV